MTKRNIFRCLEIVRNIIFTRYFIRLVLTVSVDFDSGSQVTEEQMVRKICYQLLSIDTNKENDPVHRILARKSPMMIDKSDQYYKKGCMMKSRHTSYRDSRN